MSQCLLLRYPFWFLKPFVSCPLHLSYNLFSYSAPINTSHLFYTFFWFCSIPKVFFPRQPYILYIIYIYIYVYILYYHCLLFLFYIQYIHAHTQKLYNQYKCIHIHTISHYNYIFIGIYRDIYTFIHTKALYFVTWMTWISLFQVAEKRPWRTPWNSSAWVFCPPSVSASRSGKRRRACKTPRSGRSKSLWMLGTNSWWDIDDLGCLILMMDKFCWFRVRETLML